MVTLRSAIGCLGLVWSTACQVGGAPARVEAPADSAAGEVAFEWAGPGGAALVLPVHVNGEGPFDFVLDTGATLTCLDQSLVERLGLPEARGRVGFGAGVGGSGAMRLVAIDSLRVGAAEAADLTGCALDLPQAEALGIEFQGLLGLNFLRSFRLSLDFERQVVRFQEP